MKREERGEKGKTEILPKKKKQNRSREWLK